MNYVVITLCKIVGIVCQQLRRFLTNMLVSSLFDPLIVSSIVVGAVVVVDTSGVFVVFVSSWLVFHDCLK